MKRQASPPVAGSNRRFALRMEQIRSTEPRLVVLEERSGLRKAVGPTPELRCVAWASGLPLEVARPLVVEALRTIHLSPEHLACSGVDGAPPLLVDEATGARIALALLAVQPLRKLERMQEVIGGVASMSPEESLYWFARVMQGPKTRTLRALRILLARE